MSGIPESVRGLVVRDLRAAYPIDGREVEVVRGVSLSVGDGEAVGLVGESGCGKSTLAAAILGMIPPPGRCLAGSIRWDGEELSAASESRWSHLRGAEIAVAPQEAASALDPLFSVGWQIAETLAVHRARREDGSPKTRREIEAEARSWLDRVGLSSRRYESYPHQLSGGQLQRAALAVTLAAGPRLLIADEPTTALDATLEIRLLDLLTELRRDLGLSLLLITHDLGVVDRISDRLLVMADGEIVESGETRSVLRRPSHPLTRRLAAASPWLSGFGVGKAQVAE